MGILFSRIIFPAPHTYQRRGGAVQMSDQWVHATWLDGETGEAIPILQLDTHMRDAIPVVCISRPHSPLVLLYSHGNGEDLSQCYDWCCTLSRRFNATVYAYDYSGYGVNKSRPSEHKVFMNIEAVYKHICKRHSERDIIIYGRSLGTAPSIHAASVFPKSRGLILESAFKSIFTTVLTFFNHIPGDMFENSVHLKQCTVPTLFIHGTKDQVVPFQHGVELSQQCKNKWGELWLQGAGHNDIDSNPLYRNEMFQKISFFLHAIAPSNFENYAGLGLGLGRLKQLGTLRNRKIITH